MSHIPFSTGVECEPLPDIENGRVRLTGTTVGSTVTYRCNRGYVLVGRSTRECQASGEWSGQEPFCESELYIIATKHQIIVNVYSSRIKQCPVGMFIVCVLLIQGILPRRVVCLYRTIYNSANCRL